MQHFGRWFKNFDVVGNILKKESADKPGSVVDSHSSAMYVTAHLKRPTREQRGPRLVPLFGLAPDGVYRAAVCCHPRGALLPHHFTLTCPLRSSAVYFLWHFPWVYTPQVLPGTLPYGARTFLRFPSGMQRLSGRLL